MPKAKTTAPAVEAKTTESVKAESSPSYSVVMNTNVIHDGQEFNKGETYTLDEQTYGLFISSNFAQ